MDEHILLVQPPFPPPPKQYVLGLKFGLVWPHFDPMSILKTLVMIEVLQYPKKSPA